MLARVATFALDGVDGRAVSVEADIRPGLPCFTVVGLADLGVREARERVRTAIANAGFEFPLRRITVNLAPADLRKVGPGFDLPLAVALLVAGGALPAERLTGTALHGELSLAGELRPARGTLVVAEAARRAGIRRLVVAPGCRAEAALVGDLQVLAVPTLAELVEVLAGTRRAPAVPTPMAPSAETGRLGTEGDPYNARDGQDAHGTDALDLADVHGHDALVPALEVAAAGGHNLLLQGPPGTGKTMIARRIPSILPPLSRDEALDVTRVHSVAGLHRGGGLVASRPFRAPHHTVSAAGLVGGGASPAPGEATLAHHGVLFLDELSEFTRPALEALRQPLEDGSVTIVRGQRALTFPTAVMLVAATNPCPCGRGAESCRCTAVDLQRHRRRLSGPLLDRMDILLAVERPSARSLSGEGGPTSAEVRGRVVEARERQRARFEGSATASNARMGAADLRRHARTDGAAGRLLRAAVDGGALSARGHARVLRVARTVADLAGHEHLTEDDVATAVTLRGADGHQEGAA